MLLRNKARLLKALAIACALTAIGNLSFAQDNIQEIISNIQPVGQVCLVGQDCSGGDTANETTTTAAVSQPVTAAPVTAAPEPATAPAASAEPAFDLQGTYQLSCFACHSTGAAGAPVTHDTAAWEERMAQGMDTVLANSVNGIGAMPAKGMCMDCTEDNLRELIEFMASEAQ